MVADLQLKTLVDGLRLPEGFRWHRGKLWFSDILGRRILTVDLQGRLEVIAELDDEPSGLGFLPDGSVVVSMMWQRRLIQISPGGSVSLYADLAGIQGDRINEMMMDRHGRAYVNNNLKPHADAKLRGNAPPEEDTGDGIILVTGDRKARIVATGNLISPNGMAITPDGRTLILAEPFAHRLTAFTIQADGSLTDRRLFADTGKATPDGICLDAEGAVWIGSPFSSEAVRFLPGGEVTHRIPVKGWAVCVQLGGPDGKTLFVSNVETSGLANYRKDALGSVKITTVDVPGSAWAD